MAWDQRFEDLLREYLPFLSADEPLTPETDLRDAGLDSLGTVELLGSLESAYDVRFVDEALNLDTFATPASLWATLAKMSEAAAI
ncbi:phosphopantetheine-binding protein [Streptomyces yangpuensis]|uniref:Phosphopantetheine-binding protein n=1 Tax=Streptomyces yangpuensis TaxID=1648182 RepID=A0ABY5QA31_9ACTN|nr:phosphopantetheine-binding protein [Streptomyces yangpuensis]UUY52505.1 phosphopantetheine-binding protein [Streptomyces yangpuensis]